MAWAVGGLMVQGSLNVIPSWVVPVVEVVAAQWMVLTSGQPCPRSYHLQQPHQSQPQLRLSICKHVTWPAPTPPATRTAATTGTTRTTATSSNKWSVLVQLWLMVSLYHYHMPYEYAGEKTMMKMGATLAHNSNKQTNNCFQTSFTVGC
jgi:hypothetical protein